MKPEEIDDFIDDNTSQFSTTCGDLNIKLKLILGRIKNPVVAGNQAIGFNAVEIEITDHMAIWPGHSTAEFNELKGRFKAAALKAVNRLINYMRYIKGNPFLRPAQGGDLLDIEWMDEQTTSFTSQTIMTFSLPRFQVIETNWTV
jgi:hypothetical protein